MYFAGQCFRSLTSEIKPMSSNKPALGKLDCTLRQPTTPTLFCPDLKVFLCADISAKHYPERLGLFLVVGAPRIFSGLWHVLQPLVDPFTRQKIKFLPCVSPPLRGTTGQAGLALFILVMKMAGCPAGFGQQRSRWLLPSSWHEYVPLKRYFIHEVIRRLPCPLA